MELKKCTCCNLEFSKTTEFYRKRGEKNSTSFRSQCKNCFDAKSRKRHIEFYKNNTEKEKERSKFFYYRDIEHSRKKTHKTYLKNIDKVKNYDKKRTNELPDSIIINRIASQTSLNRNEIPKELIDTKRLLTQIKRTLKK